MIRYLTLAFALLAAAPAHAQQGNLPKPVQKLPAYPPVVCVAPNWATEPCESRRPPAQPAARIPAKTKAVLYHEPGGILQEHVKRWQALAASEDDVEIRGPCVSGCTMIMAFVPSDRICFGDAASLQFHMARNATNQEPNVDTARWMLNQYPQDISLSIRAKGGVEKMTSYVIWKLTAEELWAMGYRKCEPEAPPVPMKISKDNAPAAEGLHEGWWRKRDEKAAAFWRQLEAEKAARGQP